MSILYGTKINQLLANTALTGLLFADWLKKKGYSVQLQKKYRLWMVDSYMQRCDVSHITPLHIAVNHPESLYFFYSWTE